MIVVTEKTQKEIFIDSINFNHQVVIYKTQSNSPSYCMLTIKSNYCDSGFIPLGPSADINKMRYVATSPKRAVENAMVANRKVYVFNDFEKAMEFMLKNK